MVGPASGYSANRAKSFLQIAPSKQDLKILNGRRSQMTDKPREEDAESWIQGELRLAPFYLKGTSSPQYKVRLFKSSSGLTIRPIEYDYAVLPRQGANNKSLLYFFKAKGRGKYNISDWEFTVVFREGCRPYKVYSPFEEWQIDVLAFMNGISSALPESISLGPEHIRMVKRGRPCLSLIDNVQSNYFPLGENDNHVTTPVRGKNSPIALPIQSRVVPFKRRIKSREIKELEPSLLQAPVLLTGLELSAQRDRSKVMVDINGKIKDGRSFLLELVASNDRGGWETINFERWVREELDSPPGFFQLVTLRRVGPNRDSLQFENFRGFANLRSRYKPYVRFAGDGRAYVILGLDQNQEMAFWGWNDQGKPHFLQEVQLRRRGGSKQEPDRKKFQRWKQLHSLLDPKPVGRIAEEPPEAAQPQDAMKENRREMVAEAAERIRRKKESE